MYTLKTPAGVSDIYGKDCLLMARTTDAIKNICTKNGYCEIQTPTFEYLSVFEGEASIPTDESIKFIDPSGKVLSLRPDFTTSISRAVASHLSEEPLPLRLWYSGSVYRSGETYKSAKKREFTQTGVELIGSDSPFSDAEVIALTINALLAAGLSDFQIELSHSDFLMGIIDDCRLAESEEEALRALLDKKFSFGIDEFCEAHNIIGINRDILSELPLFFGDAGEVLSKYKSYSLNSVSKNAIDNLCAVYEILKDYGMDKYITIDLGQIRSFKYYTGIIFRGLTTSSAFPICGGGRYNTLGRRFNLDLPATGVAFWTDRLADAILRSDSFLELNLSADAIVFSSGKARAQAYAFAQELRSNGKKVILDVLSLSEDEAKKSAKERGIKEIYFI